LLAVTGTLRPDDFTNGWSLIARSIRPLAAARAELADHLLLRLDLRDPVNHANGHGLARQLLEHLSPYRREEGLPLRLHYLRPGAEGRMRLADGWRVEPSDALLKRLRRMLGDEPTRVAAASSAARSSCSATIGGGALTIDLLAAGVRGACQQRAQVSQRRRRPAVTMCCR
jgi:hypothetical protein